MKRLFYAFALLMGNYIDQSKNLFVQMQEQMQSQSKNMFGFPFVPDDKKK
ncbi:MAG: hypothetical protein PHX79_09035 [Sphaerochaetaceae bacterium]|nr:hypothetical protein [Sphaerochaetaceae bacterium]